MDDAMTTTRRCGECVVCCVYFQIDDPKLTKKAMQHCPHLSLPGKALKGLEKGARSDNVAYYTGANCSGNCRLHDTSNMPKACSGYQCLWLQGYGEEDDRPDKSFMLFDEAHEVENAIEAKPCRPKQSGTTSGEALIEKMVRETHKPAIVTGFYHRRPKRVVGRPIE